MMRKETKIPGVYLIKSNRYHDDRGFFIELDSLAQSDGISQVNFSHSISGVIRGLHFQKQPFGQHKRITVLNGSIQDVVVDLRPESSTYGQYDSFLLSSKDQFNQIFIPAGIAHGFCAFTQVDLVYTVSKGRQPAFESGLLWNDPALKIIWPISNPILSERDRNWPLFQATKTELI